MSSFTSSRDPHGTLITMLVIATLIHGLVILALDFQPPKAPERPRQQSLDVILVPPKPKEEKPKEADFLSTQNQTGSAAEKGRSRPKLTPNRPALERAEKQRREHLPSGTPKPRPKPRPKVVTTPKPKAREKPPAEKATVPAPRRTDIQQLLASSRQEIARLTAELDRNSRYATKHPRRKAINAATREYRYAAYLEAWRKKVERIGNLNYPDAAKRNKLHGDLLLHVAVRADGSVAQVRVLRSSGYKILDDAAVRIVRLAAPFAPFPEEIRKEVDILDITRTWQFMSGDGLFSAK